MSRLMLLMLMACGDQDDSKSADALEESGTPPTHDSPPPPVDDTAGDSGEVCHGVVGQSLGTPMPDMNAVFYITDIEPHAVNLALRGLDGGPTSIQVTSSRPLVP